MILCILVNTQYFCSESDEKWLTEVTSSSTADAIRGIRRAARLVQKYDSHTFRTTGLISVNTMTAAHDFGVQRDITGFFQHCEPASYEPELFSAMTVNFGPKVQFKVFSNGKTYVVGCKSEEEIKKRYEQFTNLVTSYLS